MVNGSEPGQPTIHKNVFRSKFKKKRFHIKSVPARSNVHDPVAKILLSIPNEADDDESVSKYSDTTKKLTKL